MRVRAVDTRSSPGTLTRVGREFNAKVGQKDPLPDILSEMVVAPVDSRLTRKRPISDQSISRRKSDKRRVEESSTDEGNSDDEVLTEDQESVSREEEQEKATSR